MRFSKFGKIKILMFVAGVAAEMAMLYYSEKKYPPRKLAQIHSRKIVNRPNRPGHFIGNLIRVVHRRFSH